MRKSNEEKWSNLLLSFGLDPKHLQEVKSRADGQFGTATKQLDQIKNFADENNLDINMVFAQILIRDVFVDLAQAAEKWGKILRAMMKSLPNQQAQYSLQDIEAIKMHCDSFIKYGPKPADEELPLNATEFKPQPQMTPEEYEAQQARDKEIMEALSKLTPEEASKRAEFIMSYPELWQSIISPDFDPAILPVIEAAETDDAQPEAN